MIEEKIRKSWHSANNIRTKYHNELNKRRQSLFKCVYTTFVVILSLSLVTDVKNTISGEEITNAMIGKVVVIIFWVILLIANQ